MNKTISALVLDDDLLVASSNADILAEAGYGVVGVAASSEEALRLVREQKPDIAILDIDLGAGRRDGIETAVMIRSFSQTAILFVSGQLDAQTQSRVAALPGAKFLQKPFWPESLLRAVKEVLAAHGARSGDFAAESAD